MLNTFQAKRPETMQVQAIINVQVSIKNGNSKSIKWNVSEIH